MASLEEYPFEVRKLTDSEGGGFLVSFTDFNECISDGETLQEAIKNGMDALQSTILTLQEMGLSVPEPFSGGAYSGRFVTRVPKSLHGQLAYRAKQEGVSLNALVTAFLATGVGRGLNP
jgi:antitoxin HicB